MSPLASSTAFAPFDLFWGICVISLGEYVREVRLTRGQYSVLITLTLLGASFTVLCVLLLATTAHALVRTTTFEGLAIRFVAWLIVASAELILVAELLSIFGRFARAEGVVALVLLAGLAVAWSAKRAPYSWSSPRDSVARCGQSIGSTWAELASSRAATFAAITLLVILAVEFVLAVLIAPNTWDSLTYHLTRAAYWIQFQSITQIPGGSERQTAFPINVEVLQAWAMMLAKGDRTVQLVQWIAQLGCLAAIFALTIRIGYSRRDAIFAMAIGASIPTMVGQSMSSQNDLTFAFFSISSLLFLVLYLRGGPPVSALFFGLAFGLAVGAKSVALALIPVFIVSALILCRPRWRLLLRPAVAALVGVILLGSFNYVQNLAQRGDLIGAPTADKFRVHSLGEVPKNVVRIAWAGTFSMPVITFEPIDDVVEPIGKALLGWATALDADPFPFSPIISHNSNEDRAGAGLLALFVFLPALLIALTRYRDRERFALAVFAVGGGLMLALILRHNGWFARFLLPVCLVTVPLAAVLLQRRAGRALVLVVMLVGAAPMLFFTEQKSTVAPNLVGMSRSEQMAVVDRDLTSSIAEIERHVPVDGRLGFVGSEESREYPYFGPNLERTVVKLTPADLVAGALARYDLDAVLIAAPIQSSTARELKVPIPGWRIMRPSRSVVLVNEARPTSPDRIAVR